MPSPTEMQLNRGASRKQFPSSMKSIRLKNQKQSIAALIVFCCTLLAATGVFAQTAKEADFVAQLRYYTESLKEQQATNYLAAALGQGQFAGRLTGLRDASAYIRAESAEIIKDFGEAANVIALLVSAQREADFLAREKMFRELVELQFRTAVDKSAFCVGFFTQCLAPKNYFDGTGDIPTEASNFVLQEAADAGMPAVLPLLNSLRSLDSKVGDAIIIINLVNQYHARPAIVLYQAALNSSSVRIKDWVLHKVTKENTPQSQAEVNQVLLVLLARKDGLRLYSLKEYMQGRGILRSENLNVSLEEGTPTPTGWTIVPGAGASITYPQSADITANSYQRCLEIRHPTLVTTTITSSPLVFDTSVPLPTAFEFGLFHQVAPPVGDTIEVVPSENPQIRLIASIVLDSGSTVTSEANTTSLSLFWEELEGSYQAPAGKRIRSVTLEVRVSNKLQVCLDDIYIRRQEQELISQPPEIVQLSVVPQTVLLLNTPGATSEPVQLSAQVKRTATGQWQSNLEGPLGSPGINITHRFRISGEHTLFFAALNEFGIENMASASITVLQISPLLSLKIAILHPEQSVSGLLNLLIEIGGLPSGYSYTANLFANGRAVASNGLFLSGQLGFDTRLLPEGINRLEARVLVKKGSSVIGTCVSNPLFLQVANVEQALAPNITSPAHGATITQYAALMLGFDNSLVVPTSCQYYLVDSTGTREHLINPRVQRKPFEATIVSRRYPAGQYKLYATATYAATATEPQRTAQSEPISVILNPLVDPEAGESVVIGLPGLPSRAKKLELVLVPGRGSVQAFFVGKYEVTQGQYEALMGANPSEFRKGPNYPVENVTWDEAKEFCRGLTAYLPGKLKGQYLFRLPTDAEWSIAVGLPEESGNTPSEKDGKIEAVYPWCTTWPPLSGAGNYADISLKKKAPSFPIIEDYDDGYAETAPVGSFKPNQYGIYDLGGNLWEWCEDWYNSDQIDRVLRGGSWLADGPRRLLSSCRGHSAPDNRYDFHGFRVVLVVGGSVR